MVKTEWDIINSETDPTCQAKMLENIILQKLDEHLPQKTVKFSSKDKKHDTVQ